MGFIYGQSNSKRNFWRTITTKFIYLVSCKEFRSNFIPYYIEQSPFLILIEHVFVCFETNNWCIGLDAFATP